MRDNLTDRKDWFEDGFGISADVPDGYRSIQKTINRSTGGQLDQSVYDKYKVIVKKKRFIIVDDPTTNNEKLSRCLGCRIAYVRRNPDDNTVKFRSGGFLTAVFDKYLQYRGFNGAVYHIQKDEIIELLVRPPKEIKHKDSRVRIQRPITNLETKRYTIEIDDVTVAEFRDAYTRQRFMDTTKYKNILKYGYYFI
jgi:hypothetical protein